LITLSYLIFLAFIACTFYFVPRKFQIFVIFLASLAFIGNISLAVFLFGFSLSIFNYFFGLLIEYARSKSQKRIYYYIALLTNIGILIIFKYANFFIDTINLVFTPFANHNRFPNLSIILPIGISYYTFQNIGYIYRIYKGMEFAEKRLDVYTVYNLFFPKLFAGPIERSNHFLPQLQHKNEFKQENITKGLQLLLFGYFKKIVIGDSFGTTVHTVYNNLDTITGFPILIVFFLQALYIYFDFSGYTDIALGSARIFGFKLTDNFERPFFACNVSTFWRRWHISLTAWCNDFIFKIVLFKRRKWKDWGAVYAVLLTFLVIGIWHGAKWTFVVLGLLQALAISYEYFTKRIRLRSAAYFNQKLVNRVSRFLTYLFFSFSLIFFISPNISVSFNFIQSLIPTHQMNFIGVLKTIPNPQGLLFGLIASLFILWIESCEESGNKILDRFLAKKRWIRWLIYYFLIFIILYQAQGEVTFIYEQF